MLGRPHQMNANSKEQSWTPGTRGLARSSSFPRGLVPLLLSRPTKLALRLHSVAEAPQVPLSRQQKGHTNPRRPKDQGGRLSLPEAPEKSLPSLSGCQISHLPLNLPLFPGGRCAAGSEPLSTCPRARERVSPPKATELRMVLPTERNLGAGNTRREAGRPGTARGGNHPWGLLAQLGGVTTMALAGRGHLLSDARAAGACSGTRGPRVIGPPITPGGGH